MRFALATPVFAVLCITAASLAGDPTPPAGPVTSTMKTLDEVEPRIPISQETTPGNSIATYEISAPGSYYLTGDVAGEVDKIGIFIQASNVTIDLSGFTMFGQPGVSYSWPAVYLNFGYTNVEVRNGSVTGWPNTGLLLDPSESFEFNDMQSAVRNVRISDCAGWGVIAEVNAVIEDCVVTNCEDGGIKISWGGGAVRRSTASNNGGIGIQTSISSTIEDCIAEANGSAGIIVSDYGVVSRTIARANSSDGVVLGIAAKAIDCVAVGNTQDGFDLGGANTLTNCTSYSNNGDGFFDDSLVTFFGGATLENCLAQRNSGDGFQLQNAVRLRGCTAEKNDDHGFNLGPDASLNDCTTVENSQMGVLALDGLSMDSCTVAANETGGITGGNRVVIRDCNIRDNTGAGLNEGRGIFVLDDAIVRSTLVDNSADHGIEADNGLVVIDCEVLGSGGHGVFAFDQAKISGCTLRGNSSAGAFLWRRGYVTDNLVDNNGNTNNMPGVRVYEGARIEGNTFTRNYRGVRLDDNRNVVVRNSFMLNGSPQLEDVNSNNQNALPLVGAASAGPWSNITH